jgi:hypothetical protein
VVAGVALGELGQLALPLPLSTGYRRNLLKLT